MKKFPRWLVCLFLIVATVEWAWAGPTVHVRAYTRRDGTYVAAHDRRAPGTASSRAPRSSAPYTSHMPYTPPSVPVVPVAPVSPTQSRHSSATTIPDLPRVRENWSPGKIVSGHYIPGHYAKTTLRSGASQLSASSLQIPSTPTFTPSTATATFTTFTASDHDGHGRIKRSESAKRAFMRATGYPNGRPGYVVDHIVPLKRGGEDDPSNMQWQTVEEAKAKDKWE